MKKSFVQSRNYEPKEEFIYHRQSQLKRGEDSCFHEPRTSRVRFRLIYSSSTLGSALDAGLTLLEELDELTMKYISTPRDNRCVGSKKRRRSSTGWSGVLHKGTCSTETRNINGRTNRLRKASTLLLFLAATSVSNAFTGNRPYCYRAFPNNRFRAPLDFTTRNILYKSKNPSEGETPYGRKGPNGTDDLFASLPTDKDSNKARSPKNSKQQSPGRKERASKKDAKVPVSSLLPPPINKESSWQTEGSSGASLSSWEDFLESGPKPKTYSKHPNKSSPRFNKGGSRKTRRPQRNTSFSPKQNPREKTNDVLLPSIADLFPSDLQASKGSASSKNATSSPTPALDGVLPVSDLFYRSVQSMSETPTKKDEDGQDRDDEELPFSAEQSDQLTSSLNKIKIRRNEARSKRFSPTKNETATKTPPRKRKLQRRGMEMLVGGVPINADPPQRCVELNYKKPNEWKSVIATNIRDFGPMFYGPSVDKLSDEELGLYCEHFVNSTLKWNICPKDLGAIANQNDALDTKSDSTENVKVDKSLSFPTSAIDGSLSANATESTMKEALRDRMVGSMKEAFRRASLFEEDQNKPFKVNSNDAEVSGELVFSIGISKEELESTSSEDGGESARTVLKRVLAKGMSTSSQCSELFDVAFSKLQLSDLEDDGTTTISAKFILTIRNNASMSFGEVKKKCNQINSSLAQAMDDGDMQLAMAAAAKEEMAWSEEFRNRIVEEFLFDDDDGDGPLDDDVNNNRATDSNGLILPQTNEILSSSKQPNLESTIDSLLEDLNYEVQSFQKDATASTDGPFGMPGSPVYSKDDIFLGGGNDGVFWNYAADNAVQSPYQGRLGLRMVDAVTERAKERHPRVIAIGDVHGCIDELQDLLRECDYRPGDMVVFLGDLVSKGPDSIAVVQMAREIGAIGVRGNHDFEVVRWHQAIKSGVDPPVVGSEHYHIANCLTKADMKWMYSLPWYISSQDLGALFVHAGFVSGIRLAKQNPRLMMNMRSILPDGTVTSKFFNNWPWARLWDGPQTVLFGHDADRGLQQYEHAIGLDTGCVYGGRLTACILPEKRLVSVNAKREYFKYRRKHYD